MPVKAKTHEIPPPSQPIAGHNGTQLTSQATQEAENQRIAVLGQPKQKGLQDPISMEKSWTWWCVLVIPATVGSIKYEDRNSG
jgi:hypothetical protein